MERVGGIRSVNQPFRYGIIGLNSYHRTVVQFLSKVSLTVELAYAQAVYYNLDSALTHGLVDVYHYNKLGHDVLHIEGNQVAYLLRVNLLALTVNKPIYICHTAESAKGMRLGSLVHGIATLQYHIIYINVAGGLIDRDRSTRYCCRIGCISIESVRTALLPIACGRVGPILMVRIIADQIVIKQTNLGSAACCLPSPDSHGISVLAKQAESACLYRIIYYTIAKTDSLTFIVILLITELVHNALILTSRQQYYRCQNPQYSMSCYIQHCFFNPLQN